MCLSDYKPVLHSWVACTWTFCLERRRRGLTRSLLKKAISQFHDALRCFRLRVFL